MFNDAGPMVSWSVLDHERHPKLAYQAVVDACRPVIVVADRLPATVAVGAALALDVHVVSDMRRLLEDTVCTAKLSWPGGSHAWRWGGDVPPDSCVRRRHHPIRRRRRSPVSCGSTSSSSTATRVATNRYVSTIVR